MFFQKPSWSYRAMSVGHEELVEQKSMLGKRKPPLQDIAVLIAAHGMLNYSWRHVEPT